MTLSSLIISLCLSNNQIYLTQSSTDTYGITQFYSTASNGLDFTPNWYNNDRTVEAVDVDPYSTDEACYARGSDSTFEIDSDTGIMTMEGDTPRYYCYVDHTNVEVTAYGKRGSETKSKTYQGLAIVARSRHKDYSDNYCMARGYYFRLYNDGRACFLKEFIHENGGCLIYSDAGDNPCVDDFGDGGVTKNKWYGMKLIIQNDGNAVNLKGYVDFDEGENGGNWQLILSYTDDGDWKAEVESDEEHCMDTCGYDGDEVWTTEGNSVFLRASYVKDYQWKWFSIREIDEDDGTGTSPVSSPTPKPTNKPTSGGSNSGGSSGSIKVELKSNAQKWWMAVIVSDPNGVLDDGVTFKKVQMRGNGGSWEDGDDLGYAWVFTEEKPYEAPFDFKIETSDGSGGAAYDLIDELDGGEYGYVTISSSYVDEDAFEGDGGNGNVLAAVLSMVVVVLAVCGVIGGYCYWKRQKERGDVSFDHESGVKELDVKEMDVVDDEDGNGDTVTNGGDDDGEEEEEVVITEIEVEMEVDVGDD